jgi:hypothetical protein
MTTTRDKQVEMKSSMMLLSLAIDRLCNYQKLPIIHATIYQIPIL